MKGTNEKLITIAYIVAPLVILSIWLDGDFPHEIVGAFAFFGLICTAIYMLICRLSKAKRRPSKATLVLTAILTAIVLSVFVGKGYYEIQVWRTKKKLEVVIAAIELEKARGVGYPKEIDALVDTARIPATFRKTVRYSASDDAFVVHFLDKHAWFYDEYVYSSSTKVWTYHLY